MGPLEKAFAERTNNADYWSPKGEISRIYRRLDAMSESAAKPEITDSAMSDHNVDVTEMVNPHAEALRVAIMMLQAIQVGSARETLVSKHDKCSHGQYGYEDCESCIIDFAGQALANIKEIMGDVK